jgi:uncharacterized protein
MEFEWSREKAKTNFRKHGVSFNEAEEVFDDEKAVVLFDEANSVEEVRYQLIGISLNRLLFVVYTERRGKIRIISARKASARHIRIYNEYDR